MNLKPVAANNQAYDKKIVQDALNNKNAIIKENANEHGYYLNISEPDKNQGHLLRDGNFDGIFDSYQLREISKDGKTVKISNDLEFDGNFDQFLYDYQDEYGNILTTAIDNNADETVDIYKHPFFNK